MHTELATVPVFTLQRLSRQPGDCSRYAISTMEHPKAMDGVDSNPYSAPPVPLFDLRPRLRAICLQFSVAAISSLIFALAFFYLTAVSMNGFPFAWRYARFITLQCPDILLPLILSYAVLRPMILGPIPLRYLWLPVFSGIASFHVHRSLCSPCYKLICASLPPEWMNLMPATLIHCVPVLFGIAIERCLHALCFMVIHQKRTENGITKR